MSSSVRTAIIIAGLVAVGAGVGVYRELRERPPESPVAAESAQQKVQSVQAAFTSTAEVNDAEVEGFVQRLQAAVVAGKTDEILTMVTIGRMLDAVETSTGKSLPGPMRSMLESQLGAQLVQVFDPTVVETEVKRIDRDDRGNVVVYLRTIDRDRLQTKSRWWLVPTEDGLRWWDTEDLQLGLRISTIMAASIAMVDADEAAKRRFEHFMETASRLGTEDLADPAVARRFADDLDAIELSALPTSFRTLGLVVRASAAVTLGEPEDALRWLDVLEAERLQALDLPVRHFLRAVTCLTLHRYDEAAQAAQRYLDLLGSDAETLAWLGMAELGRGDPAAALAAFDQGIADDPGFSPLYAGVAMATDDVDAVAQRLQKVPDDAALDVASQWLASEAVVWLSSELADQGRARLQEAAAKARPQWTGGTPAGG